MGFDYISPVVQRFFYLDFVVDLLALSFFTETFFKTPHFIIMNTCLFVFFIATCCLNPIHAEPGPAKNHPPGFADSPVIISEFMVRQQKTLRDPDFGEYSGWIELHNRGTMEVDISGWMLSAHPLETYPRQTHAIPNGTSIAPGGYLLVWTSGRNTEKNAIHARFTLPDAGGRIGLHGPARAGSPVIDTVSYHALDVVPDISMGRMTFGGYDDHNGFLIPMNKPTPGEKNRLARLKLRDSFSLDIEDPSGLDVDHTGNYLWTVSDMRGGSIFKITKTGQIVEELKVAGNDMEGISHHPHTLLLYVAEERLRTIVQYDTLGNRIRSDSVAVDIRHRNRGLEGITINPANNHVFVVNKMIPRALIELDLSREAGDQQIRFTHVHFGGPEDTKGTSDDDSRGLSLAGLFFDSEEDVLWVVSDRARAVFMMDFTGRPLAAFDAAQEDLEAIALIKEENKIYLVSDTYHTLFVFDYPQPLIRLPARQ